MTNYFWKILFLLSLWGCKSIPNGDSPADRADADEYYLNAALSKASSETPCEVLKTQVLTRSSGTESRNGNISSVMVIGCDQKNTYKVLCPLKSNYYCIPSRYCSELYPCLVFNKEEEAAFHKRQVQDGGEKTFEKKRRKHNLDKRHPSPF